MDRAPILHARPDDPAPRPSSDSLPALHVAYATTAPDVLLADAQVLAVFGFGANAPDIDDPRYLRVGLAPLAGPATYEVWRAPGGVRCGRDGHVRWAATRDYRFGVVEIDEAQAGGIAAASELAYRELTATVARDSHPHVLRIWNYLADINAGAGDAERYKLFCNGRAAGMGGARLPYPAASAIGRSDGVRVLQVYWLAARLPGRSIENPRQTSAWRYPREYGPTSPTFARGMRAPGGLPQLYVSGTAAVVGHASQHDDDLELQIAETFANLDSLFQSAQITRDFGPGSVLKVYLRRAADAAATSADLARRLPETTPRIMLLGDICRSELLVEIDGIHAES